MIKSILSDKFPSAHNCNMYVPEARGAEAEEGDAAEGECQDSCPQGHLRHYFILSEGLEYLS